MGGQEPLKVSGETQKLAGKKGPQGQEAEPLSCQSPEGEGVHATENTVGEKGGLLCPPQGPFLSQKGFPPWGSPALMPSEGIPCWPRS